MRLNENPAMTRGRSELPLRGVHGDYWPARWWEEWQRVALDAHG